MAQHVTLCILREGRAKVRADAPVNERCVGLGIALDRQAAQQGEATAVLEIVQNAGELSRHAGNREILFRQGGNADTACLGLRQCGVEFSAIGGVEAHDPVGACGQVRATPDRRMIDGTHFDGHGFAPLCWIDDDRARLLLRTTLQFVANRTIID